VHTRLTSLAARLVSLAWVTLLPAAPSFGAQLPPGFQETVVFSGLKQPTAVAFSPDGRVFVAEKRGTVRVFASLTATTSTIFANLNTRTFNGWDRGLLGLALDPGFPANPFVYVLYTYDGDIGGPAPKWGTAGVPSDPCPTPPGPTTDGCTVSGRLSRLQASGSVMTGTEQVLIHDWFEQFPSHSLGSLAFGGDGALYASGGDGASYTFADFGQKGIPLNPGGDPPAGVGGVQTPPTAEGGALRSQDLRTSGDPVTLSGTLIRVDPATGEGFPGNPLIGSADANARRIVAYGLRNPFRFTMRPGTAEVWIGDVGWGTWEEIDRVVNPGTMRNFGWPCYEGAAKQSGYDAANLDLCENLYAAPTAVNAPYFSYEHQEPVVAGEPCPNGSSSISAIAFYPGGTYPAPFTGALFFGDYSRKCLWVMPKGANGLPDPAAVAVFGSAIAPPVDLKVGPGGDLFYVDAPGGTIRRITFTGATGSPTAVIQAVPTNGSAPLLVQFDGTGSSDPNPGDTLTYAWDLDGDGGYDDSTSPTPSFTYTIASNYTARLRVTDPDANSATSTVVITAGDSPPTAAIASPAPTLTWKVGDPINFSGSATDAKDGALPASKLSWSLLMHHCPATCHVHPLQDFPGVASGSFAAPDHEFPSHLELQLTATDSSGLTNTKSVTLNPKTVSLGLQSSPPGLQLVLGGEADAAPFNRTVMVGSLNSVSAPLSQTLGPTNYEFGYWSTEEAQTHMVTAPASPVTYTATYGEALPDPWLNQDVGDVTETGTAVTLDGAFAVTGSGADIGSTADAFHFAYRPFSGDGQIVARLVSQGDTNAMAEAGVMIRETLGAGSRHAMMALTPGNGAVFQRRGIPGGTTAATPGAAVSAPHWVKLVRSGTTLTGYTSSDGVVWTAAGSGTVAMGSAVFVGLAVAGHAGTKLSTAVFEDVAVSASPGPATTSMPVPWSELDIGPVGLAGSATQSAGTYTVQGSGTNIGGASDGYHFVYQQMSGDGEIVARITGVQNTTLNSKGGIMIRETLAPDSRNVAMVLTGGDRFQFQFRSAPGGATSMFSTSQTAPHWVKLVRSGNTFNAFRSSNGVNWTLFAASPVDVPMSANVYVGLVMTSNDNTVLGTATFDGVSVGSGPLPAPWTSQDVGAVGAAGTGAYAAGVFQVTGSGANIGGMSDSFHFVSQPMSGDGEIVARITSVQNTTLNSKGGIMIRESLAPDSPNVAMVLTGGNRFQFQVRTSTGAATTVTSGNQAPPHWVKLVRSGDTFSAYRSSNGVAWTLYPASPVVVPMSANVFVGLVMTSNDNSVLGTAVLDNVAKEP
jgi:glucose/arabinose dehydrogenase